MVPKYGEIVFQLVLLFFQSLSHVWLCMSRREMQHTRLPCPSPSPRVCPRSCPLNQWCHPTISSSLTLFSSCLQSFPASVSFPMSQLFSSGGQSIRAPTSTDCIYECLHIYIYHSFIQQISDYLFYCWQDARCHLTVTKPVYFFPWSPTSIFSTRDHRLSDLIPQLKTKGQNSGFSVSLGILIVPLKCQDLIVHIITS